MAKARKRERPEFFREQMREAFARRFNVLIETEYNILAMRLITTRADGQDFTPEQHAWIAGYEAGYDPNNEGRA